MLQIPASGKEWGSVRYTAMHGNTRLKYNWVTHHTRRAQDAAVSALVYHDNWVRLPRRLPFSMRDMTIVGWKER